MLPPKLTGPSGLPEFAVTCAQALLSNIQYQFNYPDGCTLQHWPVEEIKAANELFLKSLRHSANVYAIFLRPHGTEEQWQPVYVGERKSVGLRERITQHLIDKDTRTGSKLDEIKRAVATKQDIGLSFIKVEPESLRLYVEEAIIANHKNELEWNTHS